jgi:hypothetical protein
LVSSLIFDSPISQADDGEESDHSGSSSPALQVVYCSNSSVKLMRNEGQSTTKFYLMINILCSDHRRSSPEVLFSRQKQQPKLKYKIIIIQPITDEACLLIWIIIKPCFSTLNKLASTSISEA